MFYRASFAVSLEEVTDAPHTSHEMPVQEGVPDLVALDQTVSKHLPAPPRALCGRHCTPVLTDKGQVECEWVVQRDHRHWGGRN